jgi:cytochrome P450 family 135
MAPQLPPGPTDPRPLNTFKWARRPDQLMVNCRERYGDPWTIRLMGGTDFVFVSDPKLLEGVFNADPEVLQAGKAHRRIGTALLGEGSLLLLDEPEHTQQRNLLAPGFHGERVQRHREAMAHIAEEEIARWPLREPFKVVKPMQAITLRVIMSAIFGAKGGAEEETLRGRIDDLMTWAASPWRMLNLHLAHRRGKGFPKSFVQVRDALDAALYDTIDRARRDPQLEEREDVLAMALQVRHEDGSEPTNREVRDQLITLLIQGHSSTANALAWALERITRHPEVFERMRDEAQNGGDEYIDAVMKETLRSRPPLPLAAREVSQPYQLGQYELPVGALIACSIYLLHRRADLYPEPEKFRPERFLGKPAPPYTWIPFGGGMRQCIGGSFAIAEIKTVLRTLAVQTRLAPADPKEEQIRRAGVGFAPSRGGRIILQERMPASGTASVAAAQRS